jgi:hypothetical protein
MVVAVDIIEAFEALQKSPIGNLSPANRNLLNLKYINIGSAVEEEHRHSCDAVF